VTVDEIAESLTPAQIARVALLLGLASAATEEAGSMTASLPPIPWKKGRLRTPHVCLRPDCGRIFYPRSEGKRMYCSPECTWKSTSEKAQAARKARGEPLPRPLSKTEREALGL
jgi:hypothetical protein